MTNQRRRKQTSRKSITSKEDGARSSVTKRTVTPRRTSENHSRCFSQSQRKILEKFLEKTSMPSSSEEDMMAKLTGLTIMQVKRWFQYRRSLLKKAILKENNNEERPANTANRLSSQLAAIPLSTPPLLNFPPNPEMKPTTCYHASKKRPNPVNNINVEQCTQEKSQSYSPYDNCSSTLQLCDNLLQNMFGYDWIEKLRLHRTI